MEKVNEIDKILDTIWIVVGWTFFIMVLILFRNQLADNI